MRPFGVYSTNEADVPPYSVPDPLQKEDGTRVTTAAEWTSSRRNGILQLLKDYCYGEVLPPPDVLHTELLSVKQDALNKTAVRKELRIHCGLKNGKKFFFDMLLYLPEKHCGPVPVFLGLNFKGNHQTTDEPDVRRTGEKMPSVAEEPGRGLQCGRWQIPLVISRGYASATVCYHDLYPDQVGRAGDSVFSLFYDRPEPDAVRDRYSVIGAWSWGLSRMLDA